MLFVVRVAKSTAAFFVLSFGQTKILVLGSSFDRTIKIGTGFFSNPSLSRSHSSRMPPRAWLTLNGNWPLWSSAHITNAKPICLRFCLERETSVTVCSLGVLMQPLKSSSTQAAIGDRAIFIIFPGKRRLTDNRRLGLQPVRFHGFDVIARLSFCQAGF